MKKDKKDKKAKVTLVNQQAADMKSIQNKKDEKKSCEY